MAKKFTKIVWMLLDGYIEQKMNMIMPDLTN